MAVGVDEAELAGRHLVVWPEHLDIHAGIRTSALWGKQTVIVINVVLNGVIVFLDI